MRNNMNIIPNRRCLSILFLSGILLQPTPHASAQSDQDLIEVARSVITTDRKAVVVAAMDLTDAESRAFWPLYREYRGAMDKVNDQLLGLVLEYAKLFPTVPEHQAKQMLKTYTRLQEKHVEQRTDYLKKFENILPATKAL